MAKQVATRRHMFSGDEIYYAYIDVVKREVARLYAEGYKVRVIVEGTKEVERDE
jgi:hypothetical protein